MTVSRQEGLHCLQRWHFGGLQSNPLLKQGQLQGQSRGCKGLSCWVFSISKKGEAKPPWAAGDHLGAKRFISDIQADFPHCSLPCDLLLRTSGKGLAPFSQTVLQAQQFQLPCCQVWPEVCSPHCRSLEYNVGYNRAQQNL